MELFICDTNPRTMEIRLNEKPRNRSLELQERGIEEFAKSLNPLFRRAYSLMSCLFYRLSEGVRELVIRDYVI